MNIKISSVAVACFLPGWAKDLPAPLYIILICTCWFLFEIVSVHVMEELREFRCSCTHS